MYRQDYVLNNLQGVIYHKTQPTNPKVIHFFFLLRWNSVVNFIYLFIVYLSRNNFLTIELVILSYE